MMLRIARQLSAILIVILLVFQLSIGSLVSVVSADPPLPADWMDTGANPSLDPQFTIDQATYDENTKQTYRECTQKTFITRPARPGQSQQTKSSCWYETPMGWVVDNYAVAKGENIAGVVSGRSSTGPWQHFRATTNENVILDHWTNSLSDNYKFRYNPRLLKTTNSNGTVTYSFSYDDSFTIQNHAGSTTFGTFDVSYSENGKYALFSRNTTMIRVNLDTKMVLTYGAPSGWYPGSQMDTVASITNNGAYAAVTSKRNASRWLKVFDLTNCQDGEHAYITASVTSSNCTWMDYKNFISASIPSYNTITKGEFLDDKTVAFYHNNGDNPATYTQYLMSIGGSGVKKYMALGDSIASGEGAYNYDYPTDEGGGFDKNNCHLSTRSYPYLIDAAIDINWFSSFACSGAGLINVTGGGDGVSEDEDYPFKDNQYYHEGYDTTFYWSPGYERQIKKVVDQKPNIITINIAANDIDFSKKLISCLGAGTCFSSYEERKELANEINSVFNKSYRAFGRLKKAAAVGAKVYIVGYPKFFNPSGACMPNVGLNTDELQLANDFVDRLNLVLSSAAAKAGVAYIDVGDAFMGNRHCEGGIGDVAVNGLTAGNDNYVIGNESYHPNQLGHRKLRDAVLTATSAFTAAMPTPDSSVTAPLIDDSIPLLANAPKLNRPLRSLYYDKDMIKDVIYKTNTLDVSIKGVSANTKSGASYQAEMHSTPISLGTFTSNDSGDIDISAPLPNSLDSGFHTLHIYGKDINNQDIDIYKTIYVAESEEDWDGNGINNNEDPCLVIEPSGIDEDEDGIDDACDPVIGEIPEEEKDEDEQQAYNIFHHNDTRVAVLGTLRYKKHEDRIDA